MRIALFSSRFAPSVGGIETVARLLATEWSSAGHAVTVCTETSIHGAEVGDSSLPYVVLRSPRRAVLRRVVGASDVVCMMCISLRTFAQILPCRAPVIVSHQTWYHGATFLERIAAQIKTVLTRYCINVAPSNAIKGALLGKCAVIPNPYDSKMFYTFGSQMERPPSLVCVARLVSDKGVDIALRAFASIASEVPQLTLTIVGEGPERSALEALARESGVRSRVVFLGALQGAALCSELNKHTVQIVPSRWNEPFGIVALEGIACGLTVIGSSGGGLPEVIGDCGVTFENGDVEALAVGMKEQLGRQKSYSSREDYVTHHLARHSATQIAQEYVALFERYCGRH